MDTSFNLYERPFIVIWETTRACALACRHCRAEATPRRHPLELSPAEGLALVDQVARAQPALFVLTGGDPIRRPDLLPLLRHASHTRQLRVALSPSATPDLVAADFHALRDAGVARMSLSLDGATRATHDQFRGVPGTWDWTWQAIAKARDAGIPIQINTTFTRQNLAEFEDFTHLLETLQPALWSVFQLVPTGRGAASDLLSAEEMETLFVRLHRLSLSAPYDIKTTEGQHYRRVVLQQSRGSVPAFARPLPGQARNPRDPRPTHVGQGGRAPLGINDGKGFVFISHTGQIQPSGFLPLTAGNVRHDELLDVYQHSTLFRSLRDTALLEGKCGQCEFKNICGGSRSRAFAVSGNPLGEEPLCSYHPPAYTRSRPHAPTTPQPYAHAHAVAIAS